MRCDYDDDDNDKTDKNERPAETITQIVTPVESNDFPTDKLIASNSTLRRFVTSRKQNKENLPFNTALVAEFSQR